MLGYFKGSAVFTLVCLALGGWLEVLAFEQQHLALRDADIVTGGKRAGLHLQGEDEREAVPHRLRGERGEEGALDRELLLDAGVAEVLAEGLDGGAAAEALGGGEP